MATKVCYARIRWTRMDRRIQALGSSSSFHFWYNCLGHQTVPTPSSIFTSEQKQRRIGATVPGSRTYRDGLNAIRIGGFLHTGKPGAISWKNRFHVITETDALGVLVF